MGKKINPGDGKHAAVPLYRYVVEISGDSFTLRQHRPPLNRVGVWCIMAHLSLMMLRCTVGAAPLDSGMRNSPALSKVRCSPRDTVKTAWPV